MGPVGSFGPRVASGSLVQAREGETHRAPCAAFERAMHVAGVAHEVRAGPREAGEELEWQQVALEAIARSAGRHEVAGIVCPAARCGHDMIERRRALIERHGAIHAALTAVTQRALPERTFQCDVHEEGRRVSVAGMSRIV